MALTKSNKKPNLMNKVTYLLVCLCLCNLSFSFENIEDKSKEISFEYNLPQRVRINCITASGHIRHLLLAFDDYATDGYDPGYDAYTYDFIPYDLNWIIGEDRFVVQGVGTFDETKKYPLGMFMSNSGTMEIGLTELENFETEIDVYIYDALEDSYTRINETKFIKEMASGEYTDRFFIAFQEPSESQQNITLSTDYETINDSSIKYLPNSKNIKIGTANNYILENATIYNISGQKIFSNNYNNKNEVAINTTALSSGIYIVQAKANNNITTKKLVIY